MKKLTLKLDELEVRSFVTDDQKRARGTVNAHVDDSGFCSSICDFDLGNHTCACGDPEPGGLSYDQTWGSPLEYGYQEAAPNTAA
jgi:hypothetical protein